ncbi:MAG TPA: DUF2505 domain-containing protein [Burkholderiaceae bacterium]|nr:DUF2505 domain-containing protein [Burkholderiaceae bacterium]
MTQDFPAGLDRLWAVFGQAGYVRSKYRALGAAKVLLRHFEATAQAIDIDLERDLPVDAAQLPPWSRPLAGARQTLRHRTAWRREGPEQASADLDISVKGLPLHARGLAHIAQVAPGLTRMQISWRVQSALPVIGGRVEQLLADQVRAGLAADHAFTLKFLAGAATGLHDGAG